MPRQTWLFGGLDLGRDDLARDPQFVGESPTMRDVCGRLARSGRRRATVLITGETGTGKERAAEYLHRHSPRRAGPFVVVNCGALPRELIESELFGHLRGAFTGAVGERLGAFRRAHGGILVLDEIGEMPLASQPTLLRVIEDGYVQPVGSDVKHAVDVHVVCLTNADLAAAVAAGRFRADLYHRTNVLPIHLPPLRERAPDIPALLASFLAPANVAMAREAGWITQDALDLLVRYPWPGNVRQLRNVAERIVAESPGDRPLGRDDVADLLDRVPIAEAPVAPPAGDRVDAGPACTTLGRARPSTAHAELAWIFAVLREEGGSVTRAAPRLGLTRTSFWPAVEARQAMVKASSAG